MRYIVILFTVILTSCATAPTSQEIDSANYGNYVESSKCVDLAKSYISSLMKDPESAMFSNMTCSKGWSGEVPIFQIKTTYGYRFKGRVNAKNSFGGYTGGAPFVGIVRDDGYGARVIRYCLNNVGDSYCVPTMVR